MNRNNRTENRNTRRSLRNKALVGAIVAALALGAAGTVSAQTANYTLTPGAPWTQTLALQNYLHSVNNTQSLLSSVGATLGAGDSIFDNFSGTAQPQTVSNNSLFALAKGNSAVGTVGAPTANDRSGNAIDLNLLGADGGGNSGLGIMSGQLFDGSAGAAVTTNVNGVSVATDLTGYAAGSVTQNSNSIRSDVRVNDASSTISGDLPAAAFAGVNPPGSADIDYAPAGATSNNAGDLSIGNAQVNVGGATPSGAILDNSGITITDNVNSSASFSNSDNSVAGSYVGNSSANSISADGADGAPSYNGSAVVSNGQANLGAPSTLAMSNDVISTAVNNGNVTGSITQSGDTVSATVQGNTASSSIAFADGINIDGTAAGPASTMNLAFGNNEVHADGTGDLVLLNAQANQGGSDFTTSIGGGSGITATANAATADGSSVTLHDDHVSANTGGNAASNSISASGSSFNALVSAGNQQVNDQSNISTTTSGVNVRADMALTAGNQGDISVDASSISAGSQGNQASTSVDVAGTGFNAGSGVAQAATSVAAGTNNIAGNSSGAGVSVGNVQASYGGGQSITAANNGSLLGAHYAASITDGSSTVGDNSILAGAGGNQASTSASLSGGNGTFSAALVNSQYINNDAVSGRVNSGILGIDAGTSVAAATLTVNNNTQGASANGNQGTNSLSTDFTNASAGSGAAWTAASAGIGLAATPIETSNTATGTLALASSQVSDGTAFTAEVIGSTTGVTVTTTTATTPTTVNGNTQSATAVANQVSNTVAPGVGNLTAAGNMTSQVATLSNFQYANANEVNSSINLAGPPAAAIGAYFGGTLTTSPATVSDNDVSAFAAGNMAGNGMAISGSNYAPGVDDGSGITDGLGSIGITGVTGSAAYTLLNAQGSDGGSRSATVTNGGIAAHALGNVSSSPMTVGDNQISADARDNYGTNNLGFSGFSTLDTTGALISSQGGNPAGALTSVSSSVTGTYVAAGSLAGNVTGSDITVSGNGIASKAIANTVINSFGVVAGNLAGASDDLVANQRGAVEDAGTGTRLTSADFGLTSMQVRNGTVSASIGAAGDDDGGIGGGAGLDFTSGSLTVASNTQTALAQSNSASNGLGLTVTSADVSAAVNNQQQVAAASNATALVNSGQAFSAYVGATIGAIPVTVSDNTLVAQAGLSTASNVLNVSATSAINATGVDTVGASTDGARFGYTGAIGDYSVYNQQTAASGATATATGGLVGIEAGGEGVDGGIGAGGKTVGNNQIASQAAGNNASNAIALNGASSVSATTALNNTQSTDVAAFSATTTATNVGIYQAFAGDDITGASLSVSDNSLSANASANSASNSISVLPVALNSGNGQATEASTLAGGSTAGASNALLNSQSNAATASATVSASNIGVDSGAPGDITSALIGAVATVGGNSAAASASGNSAGNEILLASLPTGVASSALVSNQINTAAITATAATVQIGVNAGATSSSPVTVSGNTISATAVGNSAMNHIGIGN